MDRKIQIVHLPQGEGIDRSLLTNEIEKFYDKMDARLNGEVFVEVRFKEFHKQGTRMQVECKAHLKMSGKQFNSTGLEWDANKALKSALASLEKEAFKHMEKSGKK